MSADTLFRICNLAATAGWVTLILAGRARWAARLVTGVIIPALLAAVYTTLILLHWGESHGGFGTLDGVMALFTNRWLVLAGWVHYLAFDLFIGSWEVRDANRLGISQFWMIPFLALTFLFGPVGLGLYLIFRTVKTGPAIES
jgi:Domain of unknown function (DUF4281)